MRLIRRLVGVLCVGLALPAALLSCGEPDRPAVDQAPSRTGAIEREVRKGPCRVRLRVDKDTLSVAESLVLTLEAEVERGFAAELPTLVDTLGELGVRDVREDPPRLTAEGSTVTARHVTLEPFLSGQYTIESLSVRCREKTGAVSERGGQPPAGSQGEVEIATEPIPIRVTSLLDKDRKEQGLNPIKGPVDLPRAPPAWQTLLALGVTVLLAGAAFLVFRSTRAGRSGEAPPAVSAHELAYRDLEELLDQGLVERGEIKPFFSGLSDVLRRYIEHRFGIHAPKRTTEEFLADIHRDAPFPSDQKGLLVDFLQRCDLVKFAEHFPSPAEITGAIDACRAFIDATKQDEGLRGDDRAEAGG